MEMRIDHAAMYVIDLEGAKEFFVNYFGAKPNELYHNRKTGFRSYFLSFGGGARLEIMSSPDIRAAAGGNTAGYAHIALGVGSREKVDELTHRLSSAGYRIISGPRVTGDGYYESCVSAFEGSIIEITV